MDPVTLTITVAQGAASKAFPHTVSAANVQKFLESIWVSATEAEEEAGAPGDSPLVDATILDRWIWNALRGRFDTHVRRTKTGAELES